MAEREAFSQMLSHLQLNIKSILGTSAKTPNNFVIEGSLMAYTASGGVVVCQLDLKNNKIVSQRFFCANKSSLTCNNSNFNPSSANAYLNMAYAEASKQDVPTPTEALKDSYGFTISAEPIIVTGNSVNVNGDSKSSPNASDSIDLSSPSKLKDRVRSINCISLSPDNKILAIGESGYQPRILLFSLAPDLSSSPIALIYEHSFGINSITFSPDSKYFCSLGLINDGFLNVWKFGTNSVQLLASNRCSSIINQVIWHENFIITLGLRLIKVWRYQYDDISDNEKSLQKPSILKGKSVLLGLLINCNFVSGDILNNDELLVVANNCQLLLLKLTYENLKLICLEGPKLLFQCLLVDYELCRVWFGSDDYHIEHLDFQDLTASQSQTPCHSAANKINTMFGTTAVSPTKADQKFNQSILKLSNFSKEFLVYLTDSEEVVMYDKINFKVTKTLVNSLMKNLSGIKYTYLNDLLIFSKTGAIKQVHESESENDNLRSIIQFELPSNELILNSLTAVDANGDNVILGDKYGNIYVTKTTIDQKYDIIYQIKAHSSAVNDILYFKIGEVEFISSISRDRMIQIFFKLNNLDWDILQTLPLHTGNLLKFLYNDKKLYVCSADRTISVHKFETEGDSVKVYQDKVISIKNSPINMKIFGDDLIISTNDKNMLIYSISENLEFKRLLKLYNDRTNESLLVENFTIHKNLIIVASSDKSIRSFNYSLGKPLTVNWGHLDSILSLILKPNTNKLISISMDGCLFKWDFTEMSNKQLSAASDANVSSSVTPDLVPLYSKVTRKIIPTSSATNLNSNSPLKPLLSKLTTRHSSILEYESQDDLATSPTPSSRLTNATLKRLQAKKMSTDGSSPSRSNSIRSSDSPSKRNPTRIDSSTSLLPPKTSPTKSNISPLRKKTTVELSGSPRKPLNSSAINSRRSSIKANSIDNQEEFMERSIAYLTMIKSHLSKEVISRSNRETLKREVEEISTLLGSDNSQMDKENQVITGFKELRIEDQKTNYEEKLLEKYSERLIQIFHDKVKDRNLSGINSKGIFTKVYSAENYSTNDVD